MYMVMQSHSSTRVVVYLNFEACLDSKDRGSSLLNRQAQTSVDDLHSSIDCDVG